MFEIPREHWPDFAPSVFGLGGSAPLPLPIFVAVGALAFYTQTTFFRDVINFNHTLKWDFCIYLTQDQLMEYDMIQYFKYLDIEVRSLTTPWAEKLR